MAHLRAQRLDGAAAHGWHPVRRPRLSGQLGAGPAAQHYSAGLTMQRQPGAEFVLPAPAFLPGAAAIQAQQQQPALAVVVALGSLPHLGLPLPSAARIFAPE